MKNAASNKNVIWLIVSLAVASIVIVTAFVMYAMNVQQNQPGHVVACTLEAKLCPDGSYVGRQGPKCEFAACPTPTTPPVKGGGCVVGGCSGELCSDSSEGPLVSNCIYRPEFSCYKGATCERQSNGACGWTQTAALKSCLQNPPAAQ